uniref:MI domain-containing protein n=1 Tax=Araucaria cunninghamii TaxID=56994 RepID=A0A0D6QVN7_ARACU
MSDSEEYGRKRSSGKYATDDDISFEDDRKSSRHFDGKHKLEDGEIRPSRRESREGGRRNTSVDRDDVRVNGDSPRDDKKYHGRGHRSGDGKSRRVNSDDGKDSRKHDRSPSVDGDDARVSEEIFRGGKDYSRPQEKSGRERRRSDEREKSVEVGEENKRSQRSRDEKISDSRRENERDSDSRRKKKAEDDSERHRRRDENGRDRERDRYSDYSRKYRDEKSDRERGRGRYEDHRERRKHDDDERGSDKFDPKLDGGRGKDRDKGRGKIDEDDRKIEKSGSRVSRKRADESDEEVPAVRNRAREEREANIPAELPKEKPSAVSTQTAKGMGEVGKAEKGLGRSGGVYIPPFKLAQMMKDVQDKSSVEYQRMTWDALRKSINGLVNKVNASNIKNIIPELLAENLIRGRGLFCRSCMKSQMASPGFTDVFAALVAVVNTKFPEVGNLLLRRIILQLKRAYKRNDKHVLIAAAKFIAHLVNQQVAHEIIALELLTVLLENPTDDSVEVAVGFVKESGSILQDLSPQGLFGIFERFRGILHEGEIDKRVQFLIEGLFAIRKAKFQGYPAVRPELDLVEQEDQFTHEISLEDELEQEAGLDIFKPDPEFVEHEKAYEKLKKEILGDESSDEAEGENDSGEESDDDEDEEEENEEQLRIKDETETNLVNLRRTIYLTIMSSVDFEEAGHKLLKIKLEPGQEMELCIMLLECCSQERTYLRYYGLLGQRFCMINKIYQEFFDKCFVQQYSMIHRLETNKLRNVAKFFAHLLGTDALPWHCLAYIRLTEEDTTSSSRIFIKILFQELAEQLGIRLLNERLNDPTMQESFDSIFPKDNPKNSRFAINFFTSIGLGGITESLREYLKNMPRFIMQQQKSISESDAPASDDDSSSSSGSSDSDSSGSDSESETDSDSENERKRKKKNSKVSSDSEDESENEKKGKKRKARISSKSESESDSYSDRNRRRSKKN